MKEVMVQQVLAEHYRIEGKAERLRGYEEINFLIRQPNGTRYIAKVLTRAEALPRVEAQVRMMQHMAQSNMGSYFQQCLANTNGQRITSFEYDGQSYWLRVLTFLSGSFWVELPAYPDALLHHLGAFTGQMDRQLQHFNEPALQYDYEWDLHQVPTAHDLLSYIKDPERRRWVAYFILQFEQEVVPTQRHLRKACIHNDANDYNVLVNDNRISGLIDFGDAVYSCLIYNLAVTCTYAMLGQEAPLQAAALVVKGYHEQYPLTEEELSLLYYCIAGRLCLSVTRSAYQAAQASDNAHHFVTEDDAWVLLETLLTINPLRAQDVFRTACAYPSLLEEETSDYADLRQDRKAVIGRNLSISYQQTLKIVRGALQYLYDDKGNTFIDCVNNVSHVGHCHPTVVRAAQRQIATLNTNTRYLHNTLITYANALLRTLPSNLKVCYFVNSGSEANDLAIRMSRHFTRQKDVMVLDHAYHGTSTVAMEMSPYKFDGKGGSGQQPHIHKVVSPDLYRGLYQYEDAHAGEKYARFVQKELDLMARFGQGLAAFICETLLGVGGQIPLPKGYLQHVYSHVRAAGGLCIADEVQVGFGRVGEKYWGFELQEVQPDIVVLGKPIGNGHPMAAVIVTEAIADAFNNGMEYFNTFGGNPVSMETGLAVLKVIEEEGLQQQAAETGKLLLQGLQGLMQQHSLIGDVRGHGLFVGAELVKSRTTKEPAVEEINHVVEKMKERGFLISTDGPLHNVLKIKPPLVFSKANATAFVHHLDAVLKEL